jgi:hypothetical protein
MLTRIGYNFLQLFVVLAFTAMIAGVAGRLKEEARSQYPSAVPRHLETTSASNALAAPNHQ